MVDWKQIELLTGPEAEDHIKKHGVSISEVFNVLNGQTYSRKIKTAGETRFAVLGESHGRILMVVFSTAINSKLLSAHSLRAFRGL